MNIHIYSYELYTLFVHVVLIDSIVIVIIQTLPIYMEKLKMNSILYSALFFFQVSFYTLFKEATIRMCTYNDMYLC